MRSIDFAICRVEKIKDVSAITAMAGHQMRSRDCPNADVARENSLLVGTGDVIADVERRIGGSGAKSRKNSVRAIEAVLSASPRFFRPEAPEAVGTWEEERLNDWAPKAVDWLQSHFGHDNVVSAVLHLDESTPHIHAVIVPVDDTPKARGPAIRLNAARWLDGRACLAQMQDSYAEAMAPLGLERGIRGRRVTHQRVSQLYGRLVADQRHAAADRQRAADIATAIEGFADGRWAVEEQQEAVKVNWRTHEDKAALQPAVERVWPQVGGWALRATRGLQKRMRERLREANEILSAALRLDETRQHAERLVGRARRLGKGQR
jgi:hypothetical protein